MVKCCEIINLYGAQTLEKVLFSNSNFLPKNQLGPPLFRFSEGLYLGPYFRLIIKNQPIIICRHVQIIFDSMEGAF